MGGTVAFFGKMCFIKDFWDITTKSERSKHHAHIGIQGESWNFSWEFQLVGSKFLLVEKVPFWNFWYAGSQKWVLFAYLPKVPKVPFWNFWHQNFQIGFFRRPGTFFSPSQSSSSWFQKFQVPPQGSFHELPATLRELPETYGSFQELPAGFRKLMRLFGSC